MSAAFSASDELLTALSDLLREFTVSCLKENVSPPNLVEYAATYFGEARDRLQASRNKPPMYVVVDDDEEDEVAPEPEIKRLSFRNKFNRRVSVAAERFDPEEDEDEDSVKRVIHPKTDDQRARLKESVSNIVLFKNLDLEQIEEVLDAMFERKVEQSDVIIRQGEDGDNFYVVESGKYEIFVRDKDTGNDKKVGEIDNRGYFGELALMYNQPRSATITGMTNGLLWAMDRATFQRVVLKSAFRKRKMYETLLENVEILSNLTEYERMNVADALQPKYFNDGQMIIKCGDKADGIYFIEDGTCRVTLPDAHAPSKEKEVKALGKGAYFGELALVNHEPRSANVYANGRVKLAFLERDSFERLLGPCVELMRRNMKMYEQ